MFTKPLKVIQINLHHCRAAALNLSAALGRMGIDIALIQEPWHYRGRIRGLNTPGFTVLNAKSNSKVRSCIVLRNDLKYLFLSQLSNTDLTVARLEAGNAEGGKGLLIASVYLPYDSSSPPPGAEVEKLVEFSASMNIELVAGVDANAHHICWGSSNINNRGESLI